MKTIQNNDIIDNALNKAIEHTATEILELVVWSQPWTQLAGRIFEAIKAKLKDESFMQTQVELSIYQEQAIERAMKDEALSIRDQFISEIENSEKDEDFYKSLARNLKALILKSFASVGEEVNRGAIINATAVSADAKGKDFNKMELQYSKVDCALSVPTKGIFISTNCLELIKSTIDNVVSYKEPEETEEDETEETEETEVENPEETVTIVAPFEDEDPAEVEEDDEDEEEEQEG